MTLTYQTYLDQLSNLMVISETDSNFVTFVPGCIDYAEQRIYRDLDLLHTRVVDSTTLFSSGVNTFTLPTTSGTYIVVEAMNAVSLSSGTRNPMVPVTKEVIYAVYPSTGVSGTPVYFAPVTDTTYLIAPPPDVQYTAEVVGTQRPAALSSGNSSTFLTQYCPDLFMAASMIFAMGYQRDFGAQSDDPSATHSWEQVYQGLLQSAVQEQLRTRFLGSAWSPMVQTAGPPPRV